MAKTKIFMLKDMACVEVRGAVYVEGGCYERDDRKWFRPNGTIRSRRRMLVDAKRFVRQQAPWVFDVTEEE